MERVVDIEVYGVDVPLIGSGFKNAYSTRTSQRSAVVRLTTSDGRVGFGNIDPSPGYSEHTVDESLATLRGVLATAVRDADANNLHRLIGEMDRALAGHLDAKAAIEMAAVDLVSRRHGIAVHEFLGGAVVDTVRFNAWIGVLSAEAAQQEAIVWRNRGFRSAKIKAGGDLRRDVERVRAVREAVGPEMILRVDANASFSVGEAIEFARLIEPHDIQLLEQPVAKADLAGMARVRTSIGIPVMADESVTDHASLIDVIRAGAADIVKLKVMKQGGLFAARRMLETAEAAGMRAVVGHGFGLGINTMADIMLASTSRCVLDGLECIGPLKTADDILSTPLDLRSGQMALPPGPGFGVDVNIAKLQGYSAAFSPN